MLSNSLHALARVYLFALPPPSYQPQPLSTCHERETSLSPGKLMVAPNTLIDPFLAGQASQARGARASETVGIIVCEPELFFSLAF
jgi:hypothetical protein